MSELTEQEKDRIRSAAGCLGWLVIERVEQILADRAATSPGKEFCLPCFNGGRRPIQHANGSCLATNSGRDGTAT